MKNVLRSVWARLVAVAALLGLLLWGVFVLRDVVTPFAVAFALAYFLNPAANAMEGFFTRRFERTTRLKLWINPRAVAVGVLCVALVAVVVIVVIVVVPAVYRQVSEAVVKFPDYVKTARARVEPLVQRLNLRYPAQFEEIRQRVEETVKSHLPEIVAPVTRVVRAAFSSLLSLVLTILNLLVIPVFAAYLLYDMNLIRQGLRELVPHRFRDYVYSRTADVDRLLSAFVRGQVTVCLMLGSFYAVALTLCGVPMGLLVGMIIGFFNMIPFMSYVIGLPLALLLSWLDDQSWRAVAAVAAVFTTGQFVEGNFITPRIVGESLGLHAVVIMLAVLIGGTLFGFIGMLVAVPMTAALSIFWADLKELYLESEFYRGRRAS